MGHRYQIIFMGSVIATFPWLLLARRALHEYHKLGLAPKLVRATDGKVLG
jgi:hypothetical protein